MSDRKEHWENVYRNKSPDEVSWYQQEPTLSLQLIESVPLPLDAPIIDVGGGASTLVDKLWDEGFTNISVLDVSASALDHARDRLAAKLAVKMAAGWSMGQTLCNGLKKMSHALNPRSGLCFGMIGRCFTF